MEPSQQQRTEHSLTHVPFAPWCKVCVAAKAKDEPHWQMPRFSDDPPLLEFDYSFLGSDEPSDQTQLYLVGIQTQSGSGLARVVRRKGPADATVAPAIVIG